jgi:hypothetical protein
MNSNTTCTDVLKGFFENGRLVLCFLFALNFLPFLSYGQIPVEVFGGHEKTTIDIMFFKFFKNKEGMNSKWLFFNRNRAGIDYRMSEKAFLPQFGFTEAVSYNHEKLKGFAPVFVAQVLNAGLYPKAGVQFAHLTKQTTFFTWLVCETQAEPAIDYFLLFRYTPKLNEHLNLFSQFESIQAFPTRSTDHMVFTQRVRLGLSWQGYQCGLGSDLNQVGQKTFLFTYNVGLFVRHEF